MDLKGFKYKQNRPAMQTGDCLEFASNSVLGKMIRWKTGRDVNHTSLIIEADFLNNRRIMILEALEKGIVPNFLSVRLKQFDGEVYWLKLKPDYASRRIQIASEALKYVGVPYDYGSIFKQLFGKVSVDLKNLFCSEYVYAVLQKSGIVPFLSTVPRPGEMCDLGCYENRVRIH